MMASTASEALLTASLVASMILIIGPAIRKQLLQKDPSRLISVALLAIDWMPFIFVFTSWGIDFIAFLQLDSGHQRVVSTLSEDSGFSARIAASLSGWVSGTMALLLGFGLYLGVILTRLPSHHEMEIGGMSQTDNIRLGNNIRRWGGWLWMLLLYGLLPDEPFPQSSNSLFFGEADAILGTVFPLWFALLMSGVLFGVAVMQISLMMERADRFNPENPFPHQVSWLLILPFIGLGFILLTSRPSGKDALASILLDPLLGGQASFLLGISGLFLLAGTALHAHLLAERKFRVGRGRWRGLGITIFHSVGIIFLTTLLLVYQLPIVENWFGAVWLTAELILPLLIAGLAGMLLPVAGLDDRPRPELWGYRFASALSLPLLVALNPLSILLLPGMWVGISAAALLPAIVEKDTRLEGIWRQRALISIAVSDFILIVICFEPIPGLGIGLALLVGASLSALPMKIINKSRMNDIVENNN